MKTAVKYGMQLTAVLAAAFVLLVIPAYALFAGAGVWSAVWAVGVCLAVGWVVLLLSQFLAEGGMKLAAVFVSMGLRIALVLAVALGICYSRPDIRESGFLWWLAAAYLVTLAVETRQLLDVTGTNSSIGKAVSAF